MRKMILSAIAMSLFRWLTKPKPHARRAPARKPARRSTDRNRAA